MLSAVSFAARTTASDENRLWPQDRAAHDWYRFVLSFPPHLVRTYIERFGLRPGQRVLDPFCGTGTTLIECKKLGLPSVGIEANPLACFASRVKVNWRVDPDGLLSHAQQVVAAARSKLEAEGLEDAPALPLFQQRRGQGALPGPEFARTARRLRALPPEAAKLLLTGSISPLPLHKTLVLLEAMDERHDERFAAHERLGLAKALVSWISNLEFGPEVGVGRPKEDVVAIAAWRLRVKMMAADLRSLSSEDRAEASVQLADARAAGELLPPGSVDAVITSPPYPNEKDYTRTTRLELVLLGFIRNRAELRALKRGLLRSNTRGVYSTDDDHLLVAGHEKVQRLAQAIERRRIELGKTSGFERMYARVTRLYFGGMSRHLASLRRVLRPGARLAGAAVCWRMRD